MLAQDVPLPNPHPTFNNPSSSSQQPTETLSHPTQAQYVSDLTQMLGFMTQNQAEFQRNVTRFIDAQSTVLSGLHAPDLTNAPHKTLGSGVKIRNPRLFNGRHEEVTPFLSEVQRIIEFHPISFPDDHRKVLFVALYLKDGIPVEWFNHIEAINSPLLHDWNRFLTEFRKKFADPRLTSTADQKLDKLKQTGSAHAYLTRFVELSSHLDMTEQTKINRFMKGLKPTIKDNLVSVVERPLTLVGWENIIIQVDANLHQRDLERKEESTSKHKVSNKPTSTSTNSNSNSPLPPVTNTSSDVVPMDVDALRTGRGKLTQEERDYRFKNSLCLYCGKPGHVVDVCLARKKKYPDSNQGKAKPESK
jgi:hypothetical protein